MRKFFFMKTKSKKKRKMNIFSEINCHIHKQQQQQNKFICTKLRGISEQEAYSRQMSSVSLRGIRMSQRVGAVAEPRECLSSLESMRLQVQTLVLPKKEKKSTKCLKIKCFHL
jgi:hypothetical protein